jgi:hypothetical protein
MAGMINIFLMDGGMRNIFLLDAGNEKHLLIGWLE